MGFIIFYQIAHIEYIQNDVPDIYIVSAGR